MEKFNQDATCAKCGYASVAVFFCEDHHSDMFFHNPKHKGPALHRTCNRCGFSWVEKSLDEKP